MKKLTPKSTLKEIQSAERKNKWLLIACAFGLLVCSMATYVLWIGNMFDTTIDTIFYRSGCCLLSFLIYGMLMMAVYAIFHTKIPINNFFEFYNGSVISTDVLSYYYPNYVFTSRIPALLLVSEFGTYDIFKEAVILNNDIYFICPICGKPIMNIDKDCKKHLELFLTLLRKQELVRKTDEFEKTKSEIFKILENNKNNT